MKLPKAEARTEPVIFHEEKILKITKEVVVKFIEIGRVSPTQFDGVFQSVFRTIKSSLSSDDSN